MYNILSSSYLQMEIPMNRRTFIKRTSVAGIVGGIALNLPGASEPQKVKTPESSDNVDLVAVKGGSPGEMFDKGIAELGGMKEFVKPGQTVVVKPNIGWAKPPEAASNTNPELIQHIVEHCMKAGAKTVYVFDHTCNNWKETYSKSGISDAATKAGAKVLCGNIRDDYKEVKIPNGKKLKSVLIHKLIMDSDVLINVPVLKNHGGAVMTCAMKNLMGIIWDRRHFHKNDLQQCIADFITVRKPDLNVVDAFRVMKKGGPRGRNLSDVVKMEYQLISPDIVAIDTAASKILGIATEKIPYIKLAEELELGIMDIDKLNVKRINLDNNA